MTCGAARAAGLALALTLAGTVTPSGPATARDRGEARAAPGVIVLRGGPLRTPIVLRDWSENHQLMLSTGHLAPVPGSELETREKVDVLMYWGVASSQFASLPDSATVVARANGAQPGAYYPAVGRSPAVWVFGDAAIPSNTRLIAHDGLAILAAHHVPIAVR